MLLQACIISGCDYHSGVTGVGYKKALKLVKCHMGNIDSLVSELYSCGKIADVKAYLSEFKRAQLTFHHQIVFDAKENRERYLTEPTSDDVDLSFLGELKPDHVAVQIARGELNPQTLQRYEFTLNCI